MFKIPFLDLPPLRGAAGTVRLPGSKSISNRVLLLAALSELEEDQLMGRISRADYQQQKLTLQRQYLAVRAAEEDRELGKPPSVQEASGIGNET